MTNREIKFRVFNKDYGKMCPPEQWLWNHDDLWLHELNSIFWEDDNLIWMQYTWLKDKNWKEIYEGDIMSDWINKALVKYDMDYAAYVLKREDNNIFLFFTREVDKFSPLHINIPYNLEIIGNIYENPELLPTPPDAN